jgi:D-alanyl-D-alanine carboxypeptidase
MRPTFRIAVALAGLALVAPAAADAQSSSRALDVALDRIVQARDGPPGLSVLITRDGRSEFRSRGVADVRSGRRPTARDAYRIASMAKAFSGAIALRLVADGKLSLDDTIGERLPGLLPQADAVTLRQALHHTGGLPDYIRDRAFIRVLISDPARYLSPRRLLSYVRDTPLNFRPGTRYEYSDTDNVVVGLMAEAVTGRPYEQLLRELIDQPLGLRTTTLPRTLALPTPYLHGYEIEPGRAPQDVSKLINPALAWASGGIVSTPTEVGRFFRAVLAGRFFGAQLREAQFDWVRGSSSPPGPGRNEAGLGLFRYTSRCGVVYGHTGSFPGYRLFAAASRDGSRSVVFTVNAQIVPGQGSRRVSNLIRAAQVEAVCRALR